MMPWYGWARQERLDHGDLFSLKASYQKANEPFWQYLGEGSHIKVAE